MQSTSIWHTDSPIPLGANSAPDKIDMGMVQSSMFQLRSSICDWIAITWCRPGTQRDETSLCLVCTGRRFQMLHTSHNRHRHRPPPLDDTDQGPKDVIPSCWDARTQSGVHVICTASFGSDRHSILGWPAPAFIGQSQNSSDQRTVRISLQYTVLSGRWPGASILACWPCLLSHSRIPFLAGKVCAHLSCRDNRWRESGIQREQITCSLKSGR